MGKINFSWGDLACLPPRAQWPINPNSMPFLSAHLPFTLHSFRLFFNPHPSKQLTSNCFSVKKIYIHLQLWFCITDKGKCSSSSSQAQVLEISCTFPYSFWQQYGRELPCCYLSQAFGWQSTCIFCHVLFCGRKFVSGSWRWRLMHE